MCIRTCFLFLAWTIPEWGASCRIAICCKLLVMSSRRYAAKLLLQACSVLLVQSKRSCQCQVDTYHRGLITSANFAKVEPFKLSWFKREIWKLYTWEYTRAQWCASKLLPSLTRTCFKRLCVTGSWNSGLEIWTARGLCKHGVTEVSESHVRKY